MDIASLSMGLAQSNLLTDVGTALLSKSLDQAESVSFAITEMIDSSAMANSVYPDLGGNIDIRI